MNATFRFGLGIFLIMTLNMNALSKDDNSPVLLPVKDDPTISIRLWFKTGSQDDPAGKEGLAWLTADMLSEGSTTNNSYETILEKLYPLAAAYSADQSMEMTIYRGRVHKDNLEEYYPLFLDGLLRPAFKEEDFARIKDRALNYLQTILKYSSDEELGKAVLYNEIFKETPYRMTTISGLKSVTLDDVKQFYARHYTKNHCVIGLGGGFTPEFLTRLQKDLQALPQGEPKAVAKPEFEPIDGLNVTIVEKDAKATAISLGFPIDILRGTKEWYALALANSWMGEHRNSSSHLFQVIRAARGLNYGDYSYIENFPSGGQVQMPPVNVARRQQIFEIWIRPVPNETRHFVLRAAIRELQKLVDNGLTKEQFELTRNFLKKYALHYAPDTDSRLGYSIDDRFYCLNGSHLEKFRQMMDELTLKDVNQAIKKHLQYKNIKIAIITNNAEELKKQLVSNAESPIKYDAPKSEEIYNEDKEIMKYPLKIAAEKAKIVKVEDLFIQ
ncbi:MAG: pitrilysin family protein [Candidatus Omnitrophota bacterium]